MRQTGMGSARGLALLIACGGCGKDETLLLQPAPDPVEAPRTNIAAERPTPGARQSPPVSDAGPASDAGADASTFPASAELPASPVEPGPRAPELFCEPNAARCNGVFAEQCSPQGTWELREQCGECNGRSSCQVLGQLAVCLPHICCFP